MENRGSSSHQRTDEESNTKQTYSSEDVNREDEDGEEGISQSCSQEDYQESMVTKISIEKQHWSQSKHDMGGSNESKYSNAGSRAAKDEDSGKLV